MSVTPRSAFSSLSNLPASAIKVLSFLGRVVLNIVLVPSFIFEMLVCTSSITFGTLSWSKLPRSPLVPATPISSCSSLSPPLLTPSSSLRPSNRSFFLSSMRPFKTPSMSRSASLFSISRLNASSISLKVFPVVLFKSSRIAIHKSAKVFFLIFTASARASTAFFSASTSAALSPSAFAFSTAASVSTTLSSAF